ncbi:hypothetical protein B0H16DRAFT_1709211 [Mycena metata]|uniref:Uncharacterized protein n=1 Tax=Mycena metata TaxID=1033252 RepID=A0AAD7P225_9AGAR|nr:hypothetical protein B0H16DRAFT_1709211 [Mycena metata]
MSSNCIDNSKISQNVTLISIVVFVCFLVELVGIGLLLFHARRDPRHSAYENWPEDDYPAPSAHARNSWIDDKVEVEVPSQSRRSRHPSPEKRLPAPPSWFSDDESEDLESVIDVVIEPASPLIHAQFSATPFSGTPRTSIRPGSPTPSSNFFAVSPVKGRESWSFRANDLDRVTIFRTPSHLPQPSPGDHSRTISMSVVGEGIDSPLDTAQVTELFALQQLVAKLNGQVQELERQKKLLHDGRWLKTARASYNGP